MAPLLDIQNRFSRAILTENASNIAPEIMADGTTAEERHNIYRNNTFITLGQALTQNFPVICRLVGKAFFEHLSRAYIKEHPPTNPLLLTYGHMMPDFLSQFQPVSSLPYLADVARFEHSWNRCFNGPDSNNFDLEELKALSPEDFDSLIISFLSNMQLMKSDYPVLDIWRSNQDETHGATQINLDSGGCHFVLFRKKQEVDILNLDEGDFFFLESLYLGQSLGFSAEKIMEEYQTFDLQAILQTIMKNGMIAGFEIFKY